jgi:hypothetical protein
VAELSPGCGKELAIARRVGVIGWDILNHGESLEEMMFGLIISHC